MLRTRLRDHRRNRYRVPPPWPAMALGQESRRRAESEETQGPDLRAAGGPRRVGAGGGLEPDQPPEEAPPPIYRTGPTPSARDRSTGVQGRRPPVPDSVYFAIDDSRSSSPTSFRRWRGAETRTLFFSILLAGGPAGPRSDDQPAAGHPRFFILSRQIASGPRIRAGRSRHR